MQIKNFDQVLNCSDQNLQIPDPENLLEKEPQNNENFEALIKQLE